MYDWHGEDLTARERMLIDPPEGLETDEISRFELRIAGAKLLINELVPKIKAAFATFPRAFHDCYWISRDTKIQESRDRYGVRPPPGNRTVLFIEDYSAWDDYMRLTSEYRIIRAQLKNAEVLMVKTQERIQKANEKKRGKSKKIDDEVRYDA